MQIEVEDSIENSDKIPVFENQATLKIPQIGKLECCPAFWDDRAVTIPAPTWGDRIGYLAVRFDASFAHGNLIGFIRNPSSEIVSLDRLESLETFLNYICHLEASIEAAQN